jgi:hypothetical protein
MLKALKNQLVLLAEQEQERFVAEVERRCHPRNAADTAAALRELIVAMPDLIAQIRAWAGDPRGKTRRAPFQAISETAPISLSTASTRVHRFHAGA